jgi:hypothetical protein
MSELTKPVVSGPKPFVFVLMPFAEEFDDVYKLGIKPAAEAAGAYAERVDEQTHTDSIYDRIVNQIAKADIIVADMTGKNPNVYYEVGYAHALGKRVFLLTKDASEIPFDLKHRPHIVYGGKISKLKDELGRSLAWAVENPTGSNARRKSCPFELWIGETRVLEVGTGEVQKLSVVRDPRLKQWHLPLRFRNTTHRWVRVSRVYWLTSRGCPVVPYRSAYGTEVPAIFVHSGDSEDAAGLQLRYSVDGRCPDLPPLAVEEASIALMTTGDCSRAWNIRIEILADTSAYRFDCLMDVSDTPNKHA